MLGFRYRVLDFDGVPDLRAERLRVRVEIHTTRNRKLS